MGTFIVNFICLLIVIAAVVSVIMVTRKLANAISLGRELAKELKSSAFNLEKVHKSLLDQSKTMYDEGQKLETRLYETQKIKKNINNLITHMEESYINTKKAYTEVENLKTNIFNDIEQLKNEKEKLPKVPKYLNRDFKMNSERKNLYTPSFLKSNKLTIKPSLTTFPKKENPFLSENKFNKTPEK